MLPELRTSRLRLRPAAGAHVPALWEIWRDPLVRRFLFDDVEISVERAAEIVASARMFAPDGLGLWVIARTADGDDAPIIGCVGLVPVGEAGEHLPPLAGGVEPLVVVRPDAWRHGFATEALAEVLRWAFASSPERDAVVAAVDVPNESSHRLLERLGFEPVAEGTGPRLPLRGYRLTRTRFDAGAIAAAAS